LLWRFRFPLEAPAILFYVATDVAFFWPLRSPYRCLSFFA